MALKSWPRANKPLDWLALPEGSSKFNSPLTSLFGTADSLDFWKPTSGATATVYESLRSDLSCRLASSSKSWTVASADVSRPAVATTLFRDEDSDLLKESLEKLTIGAHAFVVDRFTKLSEEVAVNSTLTAYDDDGFELNGWSTASSSANSVNESQLAELRDNFTASLLASLKADPLQPGVMTEADRIVGRGIAANRLATLAWLNSIFLQKFSNAGVATDILLLVGRLPYEIACPIGPTMALAGLNHVSPAVQEAAIRAFEYWGNEESLQVLKSTRVNPQWLRDYVSQVIADIESELCVA